MNFHNKQNEEGFVLVTAMIMLLVLTMIGFLANKNTSTELMISGNDRVHKQTFYQADGGTEIAQVTVFKNYICSSVSDGFKSTSTTPSGVPIAKIGDFILVEDLKFANTVPLLNSGQEVKDVISDTNRMAVYYPDKIFNNASPHTNILTTSKNILNAGDGQTFISGYDTGTGSGAGGTSRLYTIASQHIGKSNSQSLIQVRWKLSNSIVSGASTYDCEY